MTSAYTDLISRLGSGSGEDAALDTAIADLLGHEVREFGGGNTFHFASPVTSSLDATIALVSRVLPKAWFCASSCRLGMECGISVEEEQSDGGWALWEFEGRHLSSPSRALLAALLRALEAKEKQG